MIPSMRPSPPKGRALPALAAGLCCIALLITLGCSSRWAEAAAALGGARLVRPAVAFEILRDSPEMLIIDLRSRPEFMGPFGHIKGAVNIPLEDLEARMVELAGVSSQAFLIYCSGADDPRGAEGARLLMRRKLKYAFVLEGGIEGWRAAGFGTVDRHGDHLPASDNLTRPSDRLPDKTN